MKYPKYIKTYDGYIGTFQYLDFGMFPVYRFDGGSRIADDLEIENGSDNKDDLLKGSVKMKYKPYNNMLKAVNVRMSKRRQTMNSFFPNKVTVDIVRKSYPVGTRVELVKMDDVQAPPVGTRGTVRGVDDLASILVKWDNGSSLNVVYGEDEVKRVDL